MNINQLESGALRLEKQCYDINEKLNHFAYKSEMEKFTKKIE